MLQAMQAKQQSQMAPQQGAPQQGQAEKQGGGDALVSMITEVDQDLTKLAQTFAKQMPEAAQALAQLNEQYRKIIQGVYQRAGSGQAPQGPQAQQMGQPEVGSRGSQSQQM